MCVWVERESKDEAKRQMKSTMNGSTKTRQEALRTSSRSDLVDGTSDSGDTLFAELGMLESSGSL